MPSNGHSNGHSRWYRLVLPLSMALLAHTLLIAGIIHLLPPTESPPVEEVRFTLVRPGSDVSARKSSAADSARASTSRPATQTDLSEALEEFTVPPITTESSARTTQEAQPVKQPDSATKQAGESQTQPAQKTVTKPSPQKPAAASSQSSPHSVSGMPSVKGKTAPLPAEAEAKSDTPRISDNKSKDPYVAVLWEYISKELYRHPVAGLRNLDRTRVLRMELSLLQSGVVRRVDIVESSGSDSLDAAARRSALSASPYPKPPESAQSRGYRFQVELQFRPNRS